MHHYKLWSLEPEIKKYEFLCAVIKWVQKSCLVPTDSGLLRYFLSYIIISYRCNNNTVAATVVVCGNWWVTSHLNFSMMTRKKNLTRVLFCSNYLMNPEFIRDVFRKKVPIEIILYNTDIVNIFFPSLPFRVFLLSKLVHAVSGLWSWVKREHILIFNQ